ncbi:hypothetical protein HanPI659440_Chr03g0096551 [Helianthus annuus]|nr:hypothetical protein HanPI659440_Chr03g0096551 [Helianthus annuus]
MESTGNALLEEVAIVIKELNKALDKFEPSRLLSVPDDKELLLSIIIITLGARGTDA